MSNFNPDLNGAIFIKKPKEAKSGKTYFPGILEINGQKYSLFAYKRQSKAGEDYISFFGNKYEEKPKPQEQSTDTIDIGEINF